MTGLKFHPNILIVTEGYTERNYFRHLAQRDAGYSVHVEKSPQEKAIKAIRFCASEFKERYSRKDGDVAFCVVDIDNNSEKDLINTIKFAKKNDITLVLSNPCFEIYFLMHFTKDIQNRMTPKETKDELRKHIRDYSETKDCWDILFYKQQKALTVSRDFAFDPNTFVLDRLPNGTNIYELFDRIEEFKRKNE